MSYTKFAKRNIRRSPFQAIAASMVMFLTFFALLTFVLLAAGSQVVLRYYESKPQIIAFFKDGTTDADITAIQGALGNETRVTKLSLSPKRKLFKFIGKEIKMILPFWSW